MTDTQVATRPRPDEATIAHDVLESLIEGCQVISFDWRYLYLNETAARQGGRPKGELLGRTMMECYPGIDRTEMFALLRRCMNERVPHEMLNEFTFVDGSKGWFQLRMLPMPEGACVLSMDITERKRSELALRKTEEQLIHAQKMEAVGRLAGGIAHDFNNLLSVIMGFANFAQEELPDTSQVRSDIQEVLKAADRAANLTRQLLLFSRKGVAEAPRRLDLNALVKDVDKMLRRIIGEDIKLSSKPADDLWPVRIDPGQLEQVLVNLIVNARDAMPDGGKLLIETANAFVDAEYVSAHPEVSAGEYVMFAVSDTGTGMDKETQRQIFEPFFTTKEVGKGTGLGLATVFAIVKNAGGHIWVYSELGHGTTFKIYIPRDVLVGRGNDTMPPLTTRLNGTETILLVEDEPMVREFARRALTRLGYKVIEAGSGEEALEIAVAKLGTVQLLLTDVIMPGIRGPQLASRLTEMRPDLKVLFMSGYTENALDQKAITDGQIHFVEKPLAVQRLVAKVREILDAR